ncbi:MAG: hypothetical protein JXA14_18250 [Anaerolineae bacterium]|nr:hypothetical protein [Anaerolineae bacterium]
MSAFLPYVADRLLAPRLSGLASTLVFPLAWVVVEYVRSIVMFSGTWGAVAYTQYHNLSLMQVVSVTGLWGLSFLIAWLAPIVNYAWERGFAGRRVRLVSGTYAAVLILVLLFGGARLAFFPATSRTVRVAAVFRTDGGRSLERNVAALQEATREAARAGAKVVVFHEEAFLMMSEGEADFVARAQELAHEEGVHLLLGLDVLSGVPGQPHENKAVFVVPSGEVGWEYLKRYLAFSEISSYAQGTGPLPVSRLPYSTISSGICLDALFPEYVHLPGIDIMLLPSWQDLACEQAVSSMSRMFVFRAVENGYALVSPVYRGWTVIADPQGRILAESNYFTTDERIIYADVPTRGVWTLYSVLSDWFAWLCVAGLAAIVVWTVVRHLKENRA